MAKILGGFEDRRKRFSTPQPRIIIRAREILVREYTLEIVDAERTVEVELPALPPGI